MVDKNIDWDLLRAEAKKAQKNAYANYSKFPVGAAALVDDGKMSPIITRTRWWGFNN